MKRLASPETQMSLAVDENRFAEWAEPLSLRQREQWHRKKLSNSPDMRNFTAPQRHCPVVGLLSIHTPRDRHRPAASRTHFFVPLYPRVGSRSKGAQRETVSASQNISELITMPSVVHGPYRPFVPSAANGSIEPKEPTSLREWLNRCKLFFAKLVAA